METQEAREEPRKWKVEGSSYQKIKFLSDSLIERRDQMLREAERQSELWNKELQSINDQMWDVIHRELNIPREGKYKLNCTHADIGILVVEEDSEGCCKNAGLKGLINALRKSRNE